MASPTVNLVHLLDEDQTRAVEKPSLTLTPPFTPAALIEERGRDGHANQGLTFIVELNPNIDKPIDLKDNPAKLNVTKQHLEPDAGESESVHSPVNPPGLYEGGHPSSARDDANFAISPIAQTDVHGGPVAEPTVETLKDDVVAIDTGVFTHDLSGYSLSGLPKLDTFIPDDLLPDDLLVHDIDNVTRNSPKESKSDVPVRYVRILPKTSREQTDARDAFAGRDPNTPPRIAHLHLKSSNGFGFGNHSNVYRAPFRLRLHTESQERSVVTVAAKIAHCECGAHCMLNKEAAAYNALPRSYMEDTVPSEPAANPAELVNTAGNPYSGAELDAHAANCLLPPVLVAAEIKQTCDAKVEPAVVPKFYGYYAALNADGTLRDKNHDVSCGEDGDCYLIYPTRILLLEECGHPINPLSLTREQREACLSLVERLHKAGVVHNSTYVRNMLMQPGPLSVPREERSDDSPSFRIIDFGRSELRDQIRRSHFKHWRVVDLIESKRELRLT